MIDTYLSSDNEAALRAFCAFFTNVIGPLPGRVATEDSDAAGDPDKFYACVRAPMAIGALEGIGVETPETGAAVVGVWA